MCTCKHTHTIFKEEEVKKLKSGREMAETGWGECDVETCKQYSYEYFQNMLKNHNKKEKKLGLYSLVITFIYTMVSLPIQ